MIAHLVALSPAAMMNPVVANMAGPAAIAHRTVVRHTAVLAMIGPVKIGSAMIAGRNGAAMARRRRDATRMNTAPKMVARRAVRRKKAVRALAAAVT